MIEICRCRPFVELGDLESEMSSLAEQQTVRAEIEYDDIPGTYLIPPGFDVVSVSSPKAPASTTNSWI